MREKFHKLDNHIKVIIYSGVSTLLGTLLLLIQGGKVIELKDFLVIPVTVAINVVAYMIAKEKE